MVTQLNSTLFDAVRKHEKEFNEVVEAAVAYSLANLGSEIYDLEWANHAAKKYQTEAKAA